MATGRAGVTTSDRDADTRDRSQSNQTSGDLTGTASGPIFELPAGRVNVTAKVAVDTADLDTQRRRGGISASNSLGRDRVDGAFNLDVPILKDSAIGRLGANANAEVEHLSDFGTLTTVGAGINWTPAERLNLIASWTREEGAPSMQQIGDPILDTPDTRVFDFTTGETVLVTAISGGNPNLSADRRNVFKLGANWKPFEDKDLRPRAPISFIRRSRIQSPAFRAERGAGGGVPRPFPAR
jgi:outer membrane cobalamin receptor